ncbi:MAG: hypothetical protein ABI361_09650 [Nitrososphaera sp.]|jgi:hypothetical protein
MSRITDEYMREMLAKCRPYTLVILHKTPKLAEPGIDRVIWEHGRRNFELRRDGKLHIVCPVRDETNTAGICVFSADPVETKSIMEGDPAVRAGVLTFEIHPTISFPGSYLPG